MGEVIDGINFVNHGRQGDIPVDEVLDCAKKYELDTVIVVGRNKDGKLFVAGSTDDASILVYDLEVAKNRIIIMSDYEGDEDE